MHSTLHEEGEGGKGKEKEKEGQGRGRRRRRMRDNAQHMSDRFCLAGLRMRV